MYENGVFMVMGDSAGVVEGAIKDLVAATK